MKQPEEGAAAPGGVAELSLPSRIVVSVAVAVVMVAVAVHLSMVFLHVAPANTLSKQHGETIDDYVYPEFEQNWKLFAPDPLQQNIAVQARAEVLMPEGGTAVTRWTDFSAQDGKRIRGNPVPSHTQQNELRRAWDFFISSHDAENKRDGLRGELSEQYLRRIVMLRFGPKEGGGTVQRVQVRSVVTPVPPPPWSGEKGDDKPDHRLLPWWTVTRADLPEEGGRR
jgi:hypothetical protein